MLCRSREWVCPHCQQPNINCLPDPPASVATAKPEVATSTSISAVPETSFDRSIAPSNLADDTVTPGAGNSTNPGTLTPTHAGASSDDSLVMHTINPLAPSQVPPTAVNAVPTASASFVGRDTTRAGNGFSEHTPPQTPLRPPSLRTLDTAICFLLALAVALICRRIL